MCDQGPLGMEGAPIMVSGAFAVALSWMHIRIRCPIIQVPLPEFQSKMTKINGLTLQQPFLEQVGCVRPFIADRMWDDQQLSRRELCHARSLLLTDHQFAIHTHLRP